MLDTAFEEFLKLEGGRGRREEREQETDLLSTDPRKLRSDDGDRRMIKVDSSLDSERENGNSKIGNVKSRTREAEETSVLCEFVRLTKAIQLRSRTI